MSDALSALVSSKRVGRRVTVAGVSLSAPMDAATTEMDSILSSIAAIMAVGSVWRMVAVRVASEVEAGPKAYVAVAVRLLSAAMTSTGGVTRISILQPDHCDGDTVTTGENARSDMVKPASFSHRSDCRVTVAVSGSHA